MSIATKTGDNGTTALMFGRRVSKTDARVEAYGTVDELNATLGLARSMISDKAMGGALFSIQEELVILMGELAVASEDRERYAASGRQFVVPEMTDRLGSLIVDLETNRKISFKHWATPGMNREAATLDLARTVCRRAERRVLEAQDMAGVINPEIIKYLNRLSDLCWLYARWLETAGE